MQAVRSNEPQSVDSLSELSDEETSSFFRSTSLRDYRLSSTVDSDGKYYSLYIFTDKNSPKKARLVLSNNKVVESKVGDQLGSTPDKDGKEVTQSSYDEGSCLTSEDLAFIDSTDIYAHTFRAMTMIFSDNLSLDYAGKENGQAILDRLASFYDRSSGKDYLIELRGYAADDPNEYIAMTDLAQKRADKMRDELISKGITPDRIQISKPTVYSSDDAKQDARHKMVDLNIINQCR